VAAESQLDADAAIQPIIDTLLPFGPSFIARLSAFVSNAFNNASALLAAIPR